MESERKIMLIKKAWHLLIILIMVPASLMLLMIPFMFLFDFPDVSKDLSVYMSAVTLIIFFISGVSALLKTDEFVKKQKISVAILLNVIPFVMVAVYFFVNFVIR